MYPYGLNDNVKGVRNMSSRSETDDLIVFYKHDWKYKKCKPRRRRKKVDNDGVRKEVRNRMLEYKSLQLGSTIRTYLMSVPKKKLKIVVDVVESMVSEGRVPTRILMVVKDVMAYTCTFRCKVEAAEKDVKVDKERGYINALFHNEGMDMIGLQQILNSRRVMMALPSHLRGSPLYLYKVNSG